MDVKIAFLNGEFDETIYMTQPDDYITEGQEHMVCKLKKPICGLKQPSRAWNIKFDRAIKSFGFDQNIDEPSVYKRCNGNAIAFLVLYVDNILIIGNDVGMLSSIKIWLPFQFQMKVLGDASYVLGIKLMRDRKNRSLALSQASYIKKILVQFNMQNSKKVSFPSRH